MRIKKALFIGLSILFFLSSWNAVVSQIVNSVQIVIFRDEDSLTIFVPRSAGMVTSLADLALQVETAPNQVIRRRLDEYSSFLGMNFTQVPTPICFRLERSESRRPLPQDCPTRGQTLVHELVDGDIFWYDSTREQGRLLLVLQDANVINFCSATAPDCHIEYVPPTLTPTVDLTRTTATPSPVATVTPLTPDTATPSLLSTPIDGAQELQVNELTRTNICVQDGDTILVEASGSIRVGTFVGVVDPQGTERGFMDAPLGDSYDLERGFPHGSLMCRVSGEQDWRLCATSLTFQSPMDGCLEFELNDNDQGNNSGTFDVRVEVSG